MRAAAAPTDSPRQEHANETFGGDHSPAGLSYRTILALTRAYRATLRGLAREMERT
jgi:hypothetical protein